MARIRSIKPEFCEDDRLVNPSVGAILLFMLMKPFCDDRGIILANDRLIKSKCFPQRDDIRLNQVSQWIKELKENSLLVLLNYNGKDYYALDFSEERIDKPQPSIIKDENFLDENLSFETIRDHSRTLENIPAGKERKGEDKERKGEEASEDPAPDSSLQTEKKNRAAPQTFQNPFADDFLVHWALWKQYKKEQFKFSFKSVITEQTSINELVALSKGDEETAIAIIKQSIAKGWKGFFELKENNNGQTASKNNGTKQPIGAVSTTSAFAKIDAMLGQTGS